MMSEHSLRNWARELATAENAQSAGNLGRHLQPICFDGPSVSVISAPFDLSSVVLLFFFLYKWARSIAIPGSRNVDY